MRQVPFLNKLLYPYDLMHGYCLPMGKNDQTTYTSPKQWVFLFIIACLCTLWCQIGWAKDAIVYKINGLPENVKENATKRLTQAEKNYPQPLTQDAVDKLYKEAPKEIKAASEPYGYFQSTIISQSLTQLGEQQWQFSFQVDPKSVTNISALDIQLTGDGAKSAAFQRTLKELPLKIGQPLLTQDYNKAKELLTDLAAEKGYLDAHFTEHRIVIDLTKNYAKIILHFDTGKQYYFGNITFEQTLFCDNFLHRFLQFKPGDTYDSQSLMQLQQDLMSTVYFSNVSVLPQEHAKNDLQVPVDIYLTPSKSKQYDFGLGYGTDTGARATTGVHLRHLTDTGHYFNGFIQASQISTNLQARYVIPGKNPITDQYFLGASIEHQDINRNKGDTQKFTLGKIDRLSSWQRTLTLNYQWDQYSIRDEPYEQTRLLLPTINLLKTRTDNVLFPRNGYRINVNARGAAKTLASTSSFVQLELDTRFVYSPSSESRILLRGDLGYTIANDIEKVPLSLQFFAGGAQSIRGYRYEALGPGRYLIVGSVEYQHLIKDNWFGAIFIDAGNAVNSLSNPESKIIGKPRSIDMSELLKYSIGIGVVWVSPVGPIEITLAKPITDSSKSVRLQFTMGANL